MKALDKLKNYFDIKEDDDEQLWTIKDGYLLRYEGFDTFSIRRMGISEHGVCFVTEDADWRETPLIAETTISECKLFKLVEVELDN